MLNDKIEEIKSEITKLLAEIALLEVMSLKLESDLDKLEK